MMGDQERKPGTRRVSRRGLLKAAGAGAVGAALGGTLNPKDAEPVVLAQEEADEFEWDEEHDVVVVGSGAAGTAAAVTAYEQGASVVILERAENFGGTSGKSGGGYWIPQNSDMLEAGYEDPKEDALRYMARLSYPHIYNPAHETLGLPEMKYRLIETFYDRAAEAIDYLEEIGALYSIMDDEFPDYYAHLPENAAPYGRIMNPLTGGGEADEDATPGAGAEMIRQLRAAIDERNIPVLMEHRAERVVQDGDGRVVGVQVSNADGEMLNIGASQGVIFASGGFTHNLEMRLNFLRGPIYGGCAVPTSQGDFVTIGGAIGAAIANMQHAWWAENVFEQSLELDAVPNDVWQPPGDSMIQVNRFGHRVVNEKMVYNERTQTHFHWDPNRAEYTNLLMFMLYDQRTAEEFAGAYPIPSEPDGADYVVRGETWEELAQNLDARLESLAEHTGNLRLDQDFVRNLRGTVEQFNEYAVSGVDRQYDRGQRPIEAYFHVTMGAGGPTEHEYPNPRMYPLSDEGPYYAIILSAGTLDTKGGPVINNQARILNARGEVIPGLLGAGNCIASPTGQAYWAGGSTLGPALAFGYIAGMTAAGDGNGAEPDEEDEAAEEPTPTPSPTPTPEDEEEATPTPSNGDAAEHTVEMTDANVFDPESITISAGDTITWVNVGTVVHTSTADPEQAIDPEAHVQLPEGAETWNSGNIAGGEEYSRTFDVPGEYTYFCIPHEAVGMIGYITVE